MDPGRQREKRRNGRNENFRAVGAVRKEGQQTDVRWTDAQDQARNVSRTNLVLMQPVRGLQSRNHVVVHKKLSYP
jgi:hypothetical protein